MGFPDILTDIQTKTSAQTVSSSSCGLEASSYFSLETSRKRDRGFSADSTGIHGINFIKVSCLALSLTLTRLVKLESSAEFYMNKNTKCPLGERGS